MAKSQQSIQYSIKPRGILTHSCINRHHCDGGCFSTFRCSSFSRFYRLFLSCLTEVVQSLTCSGFGRIILSAFDKNVWSCGVCDNVLFPCNAIRFCLVIHVAPSAFLGQFSIVTPCTATDMGELTSPLR